MSVGYSPVEYFVQYIKTHLLVKVIGDESDIVMFVLSAKRDAWNDWDKIGKTFM